MFENYKEMSDDERAHVRAVHRAVRSDTSSGERYRNLAWGFIRGFPFRRIERTHRKQELPDGSSFEHNMPSALELTRLLARHLPEFKVELASEWSLVKGSRAEAWLADPSGAVPAPPPRPKRTREAFEAAGAP